MRVVVTGANGLVGSRLCSRLADASHDVVGVSRGPARIAERPGLRYVPTDLTDGSVAAVLRELAPEVVVHTASMTEVDACEKDPVGAYRQNVEATAGLASAARVLGFHLVHVSTDYVFDGDAGPYAEDAVPNPRGAYAVTKHMAEQVVRTVAPSWAIARTAVVYGWPPAARLNFGAWLVTSLKAGKPVRLFSDQWVSPTLAANAAEMLAELAERRLSGVWHLAGAGTVDRVAFGRALCERFGFDPALIQPSRMADVNLPSPRPAKSGLRTDKAARELSAKPLGLAESLARFHAETLADPDAV